MTKEKKDQQLTSGFTQAGVYARRQFCADLKVCRPPEPLWEGNAISYKKYTKCEVKIYKIRNKN